MSCYVILKEVFEKSKLINFSIVGIMTTKEKAEDVYNHFDEVFPNEAVCEEGQEVNISMFEMKMDTVYAENSKKTEGDLEDLVSRGIIEPYVGEDGEFYFTVTDKGKRLMEED